MKLFFTGFPQHRPEFDPGSYEIHGGQSATGPGLLRVLRFPPPS
jgi:hypothetical protein